MKTDPVLAKRSPIHGRGTFALRDFRKGQIVMHWDTSHSLTKSQLSKLDRRAKTYVTYLDGLYVQMQAPERYVNHSCDANTRAKGHCDIAKRAIRKGEEITANYIEESIPGTAFPCRCGSKNCKKIVRVE